MLFNGWIVGLVLFYGLILVNIVLSGNKKLKELGYIMYVVTKSGRWKTDNYFWANRFLKKINIFDVASLRFIVAHMPLSSKW